MEYMGFQRSMTFLLGAGISISTFISDRHTGIAKHMREQLTKITHYFDLWHLKKSKTLYFVFVYCVVYCVSLLTLVLTVVILVKVNLESSPTVI